MEIGKFLMKEFWFSLGIGVVNEGGGSSTYTVVGSLLVGLLLLGGIWWCCGQVGPQPTTIAFVISNAFSDAESSELKVKSLSAATENRTQSRSLALRFHRWSWALLRVVGNRKV